MRLSLRRKKNRNLLDHIADIADNRLHALSRCRTGEMVAYAVQPIMTIYWAFDEDDVAAAAVGQKRIQKFRKLAVKAGGMG